MNRVVHKYAMLDKDNWTHKATEREHRLCLSVKN
jgi:hypothetical protein